METRKDSLTDVAAGIMTNKSEAEIEKMRQEAVVRRTGTLEDAIAGMYQEDKSSEEGDK